jgi:hypothetical protein
MSTVKITDLPEITHLDINTSNTIMVGVDIGTDVTAKFTVTTLAEGLYHNNSLKVGEEPIAFANTIAQFKSSGTPFLQVNLQNTDGDSSGDYVVTADIGTNANNYIDMGINGSTFDDPEYSAMKALDGYLYVSGSLNRSADGNLIIGTASANANVSFIAGGTTTSNVVAEMSKYGFTLKNSAVLKFTDNSIQSVAAAPANYTQSAFNTANGANGLAAEAFNTANSITALQLGINATQNSNIVSVNQYAAAAYAQANVTIGVDATQNTNITLVNQYAGGAFAKANAALANSTGIFGGDLTISEDLTVIGDVRTNDIFMDGVIQFTTANGNITTPTGTANEKDINIRPGNELGVVSRGGDINLTPGTGGVRNGNINLTGNTNFLNYVNINNSNFANNQSLLKITASDDFVTQAPSNTNYMIHVTGKANSVTRVVLDSFGQNTYPLFAGRMGRGSAASPAAVANNDVMMRIVGNGWTGTQFPSSSPAKIDFTAAENFSDTNRGTRIEFWNTPVGSNTIQKIADFNAESAEFLGTVNPDKGFIFTPRVLPGAQTAITLDFSSDVIVKASLTNDLTFTLSNYVYGKVVEVWLTNTSGSTRTVTHGCLATNSSENSTTFTMASTSSAYLRYFSIDGDNANTFVAIQSA